MSWVPLGLLAVARLTAGEGAEGTAPAGTVPPEAVRLEAVPPEAVPPEAVRLEAVPLETTRRRLALDGRWTALLGLVIGLIILAGEPRAIADGLIIIGLYALWRVIGLGLARSRRCLPALGFVAGGGILGVALSAVQLLPGLAAIDASQRAGASLVLFSSGSLPSRWLTLMLVPDLLGGSGTLTQPSFFASYNLTEINGYAGILPLVAAFALLARWLTTGLRARPPQWLAWHVMGAVGLVLALGGNTALGGLLARLPFYGTQRLQSRNIAILDIALAVLLAYWIEQPFARRAAPAPAEGFAEAVAAAEPAVLPGTGPARAGRGGWPGRVRQSWPALTETVVAALPALAMIAIAVGVLAGPGLIDWVAASGGISISVIGRLQPYVVPYLLLGVAAVVLLVAGRKLTRRVLAGLATALVVIDVAAFSLLTVVAVDARPQPAAAPPAASAPAAPAAPSSGEGSSGAGSSGAGSSGAGSSGAGASVPRLSARPVSALGYPGRFVIFDPDLHDTGDLGALQPPDTNSITGTPSVQGYTSIVDGRYATATGSHMATGEGQDTLSPAAVSDGTLDDLDTTLLLTLPEYAGGVLRSELTAPHWVLKGWDGGFQIFANTEAKAPLTLAAAPGQTTAGASVSDVTGPAATDPTRAVVRSSAGVTVVRSVAAIAGWSASWQPAKGPSVALPVQARGVVQAVTVPAGTGVLTWSYTSPKLDQGLALSSAAAAAILALLLYPLARRRQGEPASPPVQPDAVAAEAAAR
jgi:hypothetical protein